MGYTDLIFAQRDRITRLFRRGQDRRPPVLAAQSPSGGMDTPLVRPSAWRRYVPYGIGALLLLSVIVWLLAGANRHVYRVPIDRLTFGEVTQGPFEDFIAVRSTAAPFTTRYLTADQGGTVKQVLAEDGTTVKVGQPLIILTNTALQLQVASREADTASQINALENTKLQLEETRFKYQHDLLDIEHQISKLTGDLARDKILLDGDAIAPAIYKQEEEEYSYELKLRDATVASREGHARELIAILDGIFATKAQAEWRMILDTAGLIFGIAGAAVVAKAGYVQVLRSAAIMGEGTLVVGGTAVEPHPTTANEVRGKSITGGTSHKMSPGDVFHIPAKVPHQMLVPKSLVIQVVKVDTK